MDRIKKVDIQKSWNKVADVWKQRTERFFSQNDLFWGPFGPWEKEIRLLPPVKGKRVLVVGCGSGPDVEYLARRDAKVVVGIDISDRQLELARERMGRKKLKADFLRIDPNKLPKRQFPKESFDLVISNFAFQYVRNLKKLFNVLNYFLRKHGKIIFSLDHPISEGVEPRKSRGFDFNYLNERKYARF